MKKSVLWFISLFAIVISLTFFGSKGDVANAAVITPTPTVAGTCCEISQYSSSGVVPLLQGGTQNGTCLSNNSQYSVPCTGAPISVANGIQLGASCTVNSCADTLPPSYVQHCSLTVSGVTGTLDGSVSGKTCYDECGGGPITCGGIGVYQNHKVSANCTVSGTNPDTQCLINSNIDPSGTGTTTPTATAGPSTFQITPIANTEGSVESAGDIFTLIRNGLFTVLGLIVLGVLSLAGFTYLTSAGDPEKTKKAWTMIVYTFVGIAIIAFAVIIVRVVTGIIGINISSFF